MRNNYVHRGGKPSTDWSANCIFPDHDARLSYVILSFTSVDVSLAVGILMFIGRQTQHVLVSYCLSFPAFDVRFAHVFTSVDVSLAVGILM